jgi:hypothetical protein
MKQNHQVYMTVLAAVTILGAARTLTAQSIDYVNPSGGWGYAFLGDGAAYGATTSLDGTWSLAPNDNSWDGSAIGSGVPGGVSGLTDGSANYIRMQDTGDPRADSYGYTDPSNRKLGFMHDISGIMSGTDPLNTGITLSFRARVPTTGPVDPIYAADGSGIVSYPAQGDGYVTHDAGKGGFSIHQADPSALNVGNIISFTLTTPYDANGAYGLMMPQLNGTTPTSAVDFTSSGTPNFLPIADTTQWHEFWITIQAGGAGTQVVNIYMDGSTTPTTFDVTAGTGNPDGPSALTMDMDLGATPQSGALDVDFFAVKDGIYTPSAVPEPATLGLTILGLAAMALRLCRRGRS